MFILSKVPVLHWTHHSKDKMRFYKLSEQRVRRVLHSPKRVEEGIAPDTMALMQPTSIKSSYAISASNIRSSPGRAESKREENWTQEIWVMVQDKGMKRKIISAWRYPGKTKPGEPLPRAILFEIEEAL